jgi:charged multivesicular body protein 7
MLTTIASSHNHGRHSSKVTGGSSPYEKHAMNDLVDFLTRNEKEFRRSVSNDQLQYFTRLVLTISRNRLPALYSDFRHLRTINPDGYAANIEAWKKGLADAASAGCFRNNDASGNLFVLNADKDLLRALETKELGRPLALGTVLNDAALKKEMIPLREFLTSSESIYRRSWGMTPWSVLSWGLRQLGVTGGPQSDDTLPSAQLVIISNVDNAAKKMAELACEQVGRPDRIYSKKLFVKAFGGMLGGGRMMSDIDVDILLKFMLRDKGLIAYDGETVKFKASTEKEPLTITTEDTSIASLKTLISDLEIQIETLTQRVEQLSNSAKLAISRKNRVTALAALRSKKLAESNLSRQTATLGQLEEVYAKINQAADQVELVRTLEASANVLKAFHTEMGGIERVDDVMDELKEQMVQVDEITTAVNDLGPAGTVDEDEVDAELKALEGQAEEQRREEVQKQELQTAAETKQRLEGIEVPSDITAQPVTVQPQTVSQEIDDSVAKLERLSLVVEGQQDDPR